ncbi:MAG: hypothetical protein HY077_06590 [Elusimicrobia bacterium]|nr:hypothetical protein [Elusimicrobiota bacterium]
MTSRYRSVLIYSGLVLIPCLALLRVPASAVESKVREIPVVPQSAAMAGIGGADANIPLIAKTIEQQAAAIAPLSVLTAPPAVPGHDASVTPVEPAKTPVLEVLRERTEALAQPGAQPEREIPQLYQGKDRAPAVSVPDSVPEGAPEAAPPVKKGLRRIVESVASWARGDRLQKALGARDVPLLNDMLNDLRVVREELDDPPHSLLDELGLTVFTGQFQRARGHLKALTSDMPEIGAMDDLRGRVKGVEKKLPPQDLRGAGVLSAAVAEVLASLSGDPFRIQERLSRLVDGFDHANLPRPLDDFQKRLSMRGSWHARERGLSRRGAQTSPVQKYNDCWIRSIYELPIAALEPLRRAATYEQFLERVEAAFSAENVKKNGFSYSDVPALMKKLGLKATPHRIKSQEELESLIGRHGPVIAAVGWFEPDAPTLEIWQAWQRYHNHVMILTRKSGPPWDRRFVAVDSLVPHETSYTSTELLLMRATIYTVEPAGEDSAQRQRRFALGTRDGAT